MRTLEPVWCQRATHSGHTTKATTSTISHTHGVCANTRAGTSRRSLLLRVDRVLDVCHRCEVRQPTTTMFS